MSGREGIFPEGHAAPRGAYSPGLRVELPGASLLFVSGQLAWDSATGVVAPHDVEAQSEYVFRLAFEILQAARMDFGDVVRVQTFLTDMADFPRFREVRDRWLGQYRPASTLLEVKGLAHPGCCVEIEVTALRVRTP